MTAYSDKCDEQIKAESAQLAGKDISAMLGAMAAAGVLEHYQKITQTKPNTP